MSDMRVELDGDWAELTPANKIPHRKTLAYQAAFYQTAAHATDIASGDVKAIVDSGLFTSVDDLANALVLAVVSEWSFGEVDLQTLLDVPTADLRTLQEHCGTPEYMKVLNPDFDDKMDHEPGSPT